MEEKNLNINAITVEVGPNKELNVKGKGKVNINKIKVEEKTDIENTSIKIEEIANEFKHNDKNVIDMDN